MKHIRSDWVLGCRVLSFLDSLLCLDNLHRVDLLLLDEAVSLLASDDALRDYWDESLNQVLLVNTFDAYECLHNHKSIATLFYSFEFNLRGEFGANESTTENIFLRERGDRAFIWECDVVLIAVD